jgi:ABC-type Na+ transport system ATPase subunit NatA
MHWSTRQQRRDPGEAPGADTVSPVVALRGASKRYRWDGPLVLRDVSVEVAAGALVKVRGVNGSGKSTLLRLLAGATVPTRGRRVAARSIAVGYSPERLAPPPPFSAAGYLQHHARLRGCTPAEGERRVLALAQRLALTSLLPERLGALSKGSLPKVVLIQLLTRIDPSFVLRRLTLAGLPAAAASAQKVRAAISTAVKVRERLNGSSVGCDWGLVQRTPLGAEPSRCPALGSTPHPAHRPHQPVEHQTPGRNPGPPGASEEQGRARFRPCW